MRVLIVVENLSVPFDRRVWQECRSLVGAGHHVSVICPVGPAYDTSMHEVIEGVEIHRYPLRAASGGLLSYVKEYGSALWHTRRLAAHLSRQRPFDVVHLCNPPDLLFVAASRLRRKGAMLVFDHHDLVPELALARFGSGHPLVLRAVRLLERLTFDRADAVLSTNESYRSVAMERGNLPSERVTVVRSAPDLTTFHPVDADPKLRNGREHLACYLGVMGPQDGVDQALHALAIYHHDLGRDDLHTIFVGAGDAFEDCVGLAQSLDLMEHLHFAGRVPDEALLQVLSTADVALAPDPLNALNNVSSMNKVVEYLALGVPIVSFDLLETRRSAADAALYVPAGDHRAFAEAIARLIDDPEDRARRSKMGRVRLEAELSWATSERALLAAYASLTRRPEKPSVSEALRHAARIRAVPAPS